MNAYAGIVDLMQSEARRQAPPGVCLGRVTRIGQGVLNIRLANGMELDREDLLVNASLIGAQKETLAILSSTGAALAVNSPVSCFVQIGEASASLITLYNLPGSLSGTLTAQVQTQCLAVGDRVLLLPDADGQIYYVLCKVVGVDG